jgi:hypothetical protein
MPETATRIPTHGVRGADSSSDGLLGAGVMKAATESAETPEIFSGAVPRDLHMFAEKRVNFCKNPHSPLASH